MPNGITRDSFRRMQSSDDKLNILFDYVSYIYEKQESEEESRQDNEEAKEKHCRERWDECDVRFKSIEKRGNRLVGALILLNIIVPVAAYFFS